MAAAASAILKIKQQSFQVLTWKQPVSKSKESQDEGAGPNSNTVTSETQNQQKASQGLPGLLQINTESLSESRE